MNIILNLILNVLSSLTASAIFEAFRNKTGWFPAPSEPPKWASPKSGGDTRERNREVLTWRLFNFLFYFVTFSMLYIALLFPPLLKAIFRAAPLYLNDARFIGRLLPQVAVGSGIVQFSFVLIAFTAYVPILFFIESVSPPVARLINKYTVVNAFVWRKIQLVLFLLVASAIAVLSIWLFNQITVRDSFSIFSGFVILTALIVINGQKEELSRTAQ